MKIATMFLFFLAFSFLALAVDPIWIQGSPNFAAANKSINLSFTLAEATWCKGNIGSDVAFQDMSISFDELNGTFSTTVLPLPMRRHDVFIRCINENYLSTTPAFFFSFIVLPEENLPDNIEQRLLPYGPPEQNKQVSTSSSDAGPNTVKPPVLPVVNSSKPPDLAVPKLNEPVPNVEKTATPFTAFVVAGQYNWLPFAFALFMALVVGYYWKKQSS